MGSALAVDSSPFFPLITNPAATVETTPAAANAVRDQITNLSPAIFAGTQAMTLQQMIKEPAQAAAITAQAGKSDRRVVARAMHELLTTDLRPELAAIRAPLTVLYAFDEAQGKPAAAVDGLLRTSFANAKAARLIRVDGSRHHHARPAESSRRRWMSF